MANDGLPALRYYPWRLFFPATFISLTMLSFNLLGDGLRDAFDPRLTKMTPMIEVRNLHVKFRTLGGVLHAVRGINFSLFEGETLGIVGESGCGKSATAKALVQLNPRYSSEMSGEVLYREENLLAYSESEMQPGPRQRDRDDLSRSDDLAQPDRKNRPADHGRLFAPFPQNFI